MKDISKFLHTLFMLGSSISLFAQAGQIDPNFGQNGWLYFPTNDIVFVEQMEAQADGKVLVRYADQLRRILPNGTFDNVFNGTGVRSNVSAFAPLPNNQALVLEYQETSPGFGDLNLTRLLTNGLPDPGFGQNGSVTFGQTSGGGGAVINDLLVKPNGKIVYGFFGINPMSGVLEPILTQLLPDGSPDPDFGDNGAFFPQPGVDQTDFFGMFEMEYLPDNSLMYIAQCGNDSRCIVKVTDAGELDASFGAGGIVGVNPVFDNSEALLPLPNGKFLVGGDTRPGGGFRDFALTRHNADGTIDASFGTGGTVITSLTNFSDIIYDLAVQTDGKIIATGQANGEGQFFEYGTARYLPNGQLDPTFSDDGFDVRPPLLSGSADQVELLPDGRIMVGGAYTLAGGSQDYTLAFLVYQNDISTNIESVNLEAHLGPNPTEGIFHLDIPAATAGYQWQIKDVLGKVVQTGKSNLPQSSLDIRQLPSGAYHVRIDTPFGALIRKVIKQ